MSSAELFKGQVKVIAELRDGTVKELEKDDMGLPEICFNSFSAYNELALAHGEYWDGRKPEYQLKKLTIELDWGEQDD